MYLFASLYFHELFEREKICISISGDLQFNLQLLRWLEFVKVKNSTFINDITSPQYVQLYSRQSKQAT